MKKALAGLCVIFCGSLLPMACDRFAPSTSVPSVGSFSVIASPTRTFSNTPTATKTPFDTPTPVSTLICAFLPVTQWGGLGVGGGSFNGPLDAAADAVTNIYVLDSANRKIQVFDKNGIYLTEWTGGGSLWIPSNMVLNPVLSRIYVLDTTSVAPSTGVVRVFDTNGSQRPAWNVPINSFGLALDSQGRVYVGSSNTVIRYDQNGFNPVYYYSQGVTGQSFNGVQGVAADSQGNVFVANSTTVQKFNASGQYQFPWGSPGTGPSQFAGINYIRTDAGGNIFVVDNPIIGGVYYGRVQKFDTNGSLICYYLAASVRYQGLAFDPAGELFVADGLNNMMLKFIP